MELIYIFVLFVLMLIQFASMYMGGWLLPAIMGMFGIGFAAVAVSQSANIPFYPYPVLLLAVVSAITLYRASGLFRGDV